MLVGGGVVCLVGGWGGLMPGQGMCARSGGVVWLVWGWCGWSRGGWYPSMHRGRPPPPLWTEWMTEDRCKNITLATTSLRLVITIVLGARDTQGPNSFISLLATMKLGQGNVFTGVCLSTGGRVSASVHAGMPDPPRPGTPPRSRHPPRPESPLRPGTPPPDQAHHPPQESDARIRSMSGRYASYWNAFLFSCSFWQKFCKKISVGSSPSGVPPPEFLDLPLYKSWNIHWHVDISDSSAFAVLFVILAKITIEQITNSSYAECLLLR